MTAIAYKDGILASDSLITQDEYRYAKFDKVMTVTTRYGVWMLGMSGDIGVSERMFHEVASLIRAEGRGEGLTESEFNARAPVEYVTTYSEPSTLLVVKPSGNYTLFSSKSAFDGHYDKSMPVAIGCAWQYMMGAMDGGASAYRAVDMAINRNVFCGGPIKTYRVNIGEYEYQDS